ncbi:KxYKxGKxW signal domain protein [Secundilactobacillus similis DSM 23365 = JCM 2765]|uniref:KxYKxGKxW signal domain protein n=1 Tax=Secundilactobacillus similis DSM 23365 = JCM 2765 TaxID=1423804 RepID=A0A0R2EY37_9LACO|nr:KxYKxGKxW signal domain protein [Secundilactobacillus similis DSM 23365 = JCM 2765]
MAAEQPATGATAETDTTVDADAATNQASVEKSVSEAPATTAAPSTETAEQTSTDKPADTTPQADVAQTDSSSTQEATTETEEVKAGTVTTPTQVVKAPNAVTTTSDPTIDPQTHTDVPETNTYKDSVFHQAPIYLDGKLANPTGQDATVNGKPQGSTIGGISQSDFITPQHENELINNAWYDGSNAWMVGFSTDNQTTYIYELDQQGNVTNTLTTVGPAAADFDADWSTRVDGVNVAWDGDVLQLSLGRDFTTTSGIAYISDIPVKYVDRAGKELAPESTVSGYDGTYVDAPVPTIAGYRLVSVPYQNQKHQFLINGKAEVTPTDDYQVVDMGGGITKYFKVLDNKNTQDVYVTFDYIDNTYPSESIIMTADPVANGIFPIHTFYGDLTITLSAPTPIGNPLTFVYEPIQSYQLMIQYLDANTREPLATTYQATGIGDYEINSPVIAGYTTSASTVTGNLLADTLVNVLYSPVVVDEPTTSGATGDNEPGSPTVTTPVTSTPETTVVTTSTMKQPETTIVKTPTTPTTSAPTIVPDDSDDAAGVPEKTTENGVVTADANYAKVATAKQTPLDSFGRQSQSATVSFTSSNQTDSQNTAEAQLPQTSETNSTVWAQLGIVVLSTLGLFGLAARKKRD